MKSLLIRFSFIFFIFYCNLTVLAQKTETNTFTKNIEQYIKNGNLEKATKTLTETAKQAKTEKEKEQINKLYQQIIKAYLKDLDYVSAFEIQKKSLYNLESLYQIKAQEKIDALEKKLEDNSKKIKQLEKELIPQPAKTVESKSQNSNNNFLLFISIILLFTLLVLVYFIKNKTIKTLRAEIKNNNAETNNFLTTDYNKIELNNKLHYLQQQLENKESKIKTLTQENQAFHKELKIIKAELQNNTEKLLQQQKINAEKENEQNEFMLQSYILPHSEYIKHLFGQHIIFNTLKNSNSLYWFDSIDGNVYFALGYYKKNTVQNAALNYLLFSFLNRSLHEYGREKPSEILKQISINWLDFINTQNNILIAEQEIALSVCCYNIFNHQLEYAGANNPVFIIRNKTSEEKALYILNADIEYINAKSSNKRFAFTNQVIEIKQGDRLFLTNTPTENLTLTKQLQQIFLQQANFPIAETKINLAQLSIEESLIVGIDLF